MARVMLATACGPGRDWCLPLFFDVLARLEGISRVAVAWDGTQRADLDCRFPLIEMELPAWEGGPDPNRYQRLARMRTALRAVFLESDCDYLYFHDCDTLPPRDIILRLLDLNAPVTTGCYSLRGLENAMQPLLEPDCETVNDRVMRGAGYGMGCMLIARDVMEATAFRTPEYWRDEDPGGHGEDWQWGLDSGLPCVVDTALSCWHAGEDGQAARIVFGGLDYCAVWMGGGIVENEFGSWRHGAIRNDLTPEECVRLPLGFVHCYARRQWLEWADTADLLREV